MDVILTNPPFGDEEEAGIRGNFLADKQTSETALLFLQLIMRKLKRPSASNERGGRAAIAATTRSPTKELCFNLVADLRNRWDGVLWHNPDPTPEGQRVIDELTGQRFLYRRVGHDERPMRWEQGRECRGRRGRLRAPLGRWAYTHRGQTIQAPAITLDRLCAEWPCLELVKIDAEGAESLV
nr:hypothetical protein [Isosphaera pallida]